MTDTYATLEISAEAYDEIRSKLERAGYDRRIDAEGTIYMGSLGIVCGEPSTDVQENLAADLGEKIAGGDIPLTEDEQEVMDDITRMLPEVKGTIRIPVIRDTFPCVCYFHSEEDRQYFMEETDGEEETVKVVAIDTSR
ncbi:MAG: hypothetical protein RLN89_06880 [Parvibaculum sp.]